MDKRRLIVLVIALSVVWAVSYSGQHLSFAAQDEIALPEGTVVPHTITKEEIGTEATCPVCYADLTVQATTPALEYEGVVYYFDSADCSTEFSNDPASYAN